jgi:hypothetical protein
MFTIDCKIDGIDLRLDYEKISEDVSEYIGRLYAKKPIVFIFSEFSFCPYNIEQKYIYAIKKAISQHEEFNSK